MLMLHLQLPAIVQCLWFTLLDLDDLTASTNSIMSLLSTLMESPGPHTEGSVFCQELISYECFISYVLPFMCVQGVAVNH